MKVYVVSDNVYIDKIFSTFEAAERYVIDTYDPEYRSNYGGWVTYGKEYDDRVIELYSIEEYEVEE